MKVLASHDVEQKFHVADLCRDFQRMAHKPTDLAFDYVQDGCSTLVVMVRGQCGPKASLERLSENLLRMADEAAALAAALPEDPPIIDEKNKAVIDP